MDNLGSFFAELAWPVHFLLLTAFLVLVWFSTRLIHRLRPYAGQLMMVLGIFWMGLMFFVITFSFPQPSPILRAVTTAATIPRVWFAALIPVTIMAIVPFVRGKEDKDPKRGNMPLLLIVLGAIVASLALFNVVGYYISTTFFIIGMFFLLGFGIRPLSDSDTDGKASVKKTPAWHKYVLFIVHCLAALGLSLTGIVGFDVGTALIIVGFLWLLGPRKRIELVVFPAGWVLFSYFVFARLLNVRLPGGMLF